MADLVPGRRLDEGVHGGGRGNDGRGLVGDRVRPSRVGVPGARGHHAADVRPLELRDPAIGDQQRNLLFIEHPDAGPRSAAIDSLVVSCQRHGVDPAEYLRDVLGRLPSMTTRDDLASLLPGAWAAARRASAAIPAAAPEPVHA